MKAFNLRPILTTFLFVIVIALTLVLSSCNQTESPSGISKQFWKAVQERDMESAKLVASWDTVDYLKYLNTEKLRPERFELGEQMVGESRAEVETVLFTSKPGKPGIKLPGVTVLEKTDKGWRVNVKKSMTSVVKYSANNVFDQLNGLMQEGIKGLDETFSDAMNELGSTLEESAEELKRELSKPLFEHDNQFQSTPKNHSFKDLKGQRI